MEIQKILIPHQHLVCIAGLIMYLICTDRKSMINVEENRFCEKLLTFIAVQTRPLLRRYTNYSCVNHFLQKIGFAETRTVCSIKPITDKKTVLFGVSCRLLDGRFTRFL